MKKGIIYALTGIFLTILIAIGWLGTRYYPKWKLAEYTAQAEEAQKKGRQETTLLYLEKALTIQPDNPELLDWYIPLILKSDAAKAQEILTQIPQLSPVLKRAQIQLFLDDNKIEDAFNAATELLKENRQLLENLHIAGEVALQAGNIPEAIILLNQAYLKNKENPTTRYARARALSQSTHSTRGPIERVAAKTELMAIGLDTSEHQWDALLDVAKTDTLPLFEDDLELIFEKLKDAEDLHKRFKKLNQSEQEIIASRMAVFFPEVAFQLFKIVAEQNETSPVILKKLVKTAQKINKTSEIETNLENLLEAQPNNQELQVLKAKNDFLSDKIDLAMLRFQKVLLQDPNNQQALLALTYILENQQYQLDIKLQRQIIQLIIQHPQASIEQILITYSHWYANEPFDKSAVINKAINQLREKHLLELTSWLRHQKQYQTVLELIPATVAETSIDLFNNRIEALLKLNQLDAFKKSLEQNKHRISPLQHAFLQCRCHLYNKEFVQARPFWKEAFRLAQEEDNYPMLLNLARMGAILEDKTPILQAYQTVMQDGYEIQKSDWRYYFQILIEQEKITKALKIAKYAHEKFPDDPILTNNYIYLALLLDTPLENPVEQIQEAAQKQPDQKAYQTTLALAYHRMGEARKALETIEGTYIDLSYEGSSTQAIYVAILAANGRNSLANSYANKIDRDKLIRPEKTLIEGLVLTLDAEQ